MEVLSIDKFKHLKSLYLEQNEQNDIAQKENPLIFHLTIVHYKLLKIKKYKRQKIIKHLALSPALEF